MFFVGKTRYVFLVIDDIFVYNNIIIILKGGVFYERYK